MTAMKQSIELSAAKRSFLASLESLPLPEAQELLEYATSSALQDKFYKLQQNAAADQYYPDKASKTVDVEDPLLGKAEKETEVFTPSEEDEESVTEILRHRFPILAILMVFQSFSSFILESFDLLLRNHVVVMLYLTMLVGAGGNAGNQSAVFVIREVAQKRLDPHNVGHLATLLCRELRVAAVLAFAMFSLGFLRVLTQEGLSWGPDTMESVLAISLSLTIIVFSSVLIGSLLPLCYAWVKLDPAHAGPTIQVVMDIIGVTLTCAVCSMMLMDNTEKAALLEEFSKSFHSHLHSIKHAFSHGT